MFLDLQLIQNIKAEISLPHLFEKNKMMNVWFHFPN